MSSLVPSLASLASCELVIEVIDLEAPPSYINDDTAEEEEENNNNNNNNDGDGDDGDGDRSTKSNSNGTGGDLSCPSRFPSRSRSVTLEDSKGSSGSVTSSRKTMAMAVATAALDAVM